MALPRFWGSAADVCLDTRYGLKSGSLAAIGSATLAREIVWRPRMGELENFLEHAAIRADGSVRGPDEYGIQLFCVEAPQGPFWFEAYFDFGPNGSDYIGTIRNFGLFRKSAAGSTAPDVRRKLSRSEASTAEARLKALFLGPKGNPALPVAPGAIAMHWRGFSQGMAHRLEAVGVADEVRFDEANAFSRVSAWHCVLHRSAEPAPRRGPVPTTPPKFRGPTALSLPQA
jgi:hypothetical protein